MESGETLFADVILPLAIPTPYTYRVPRDFEASIGLLQRVVVPLGKKKRYAGLIFRLHTKAPEREVRYIEDILDYNALFDERLLQFWDWIAQYYMCSLGEVMQAALPAYLKLSSETIVRSTETDPDFDSSSISEREARILDALQKSGELNLEAIANIAGIKTIFPLLQAMAEKKLIVAGEELREVYKPKTEAYVAFCSPYQSEEILSKLIDDLRRAPRQQEIILAMLQTEQGYNEKLEAVSRKELAKRVESSQNALQQLVKKGIVWIEHRPVSRLGGTDANDAEPLLSEAQRIAYNSIVDGFAENKTVLLHGLTGSGKTEIYIRLMRDALERGEQVLYLLPEIALTAQIINRLRKQFGRQVQVYHSKFSENERMEVWNAACKDEASIVIGARSALFLPFKQLGLIIVDEEHDPSYKQNDPAPRYNARDAAIVRGRIQSCPVLLGSATPSVESYFNAQNSKYHLVALHERFGGAVLPDVLIADLKENTRKGKMEGIFSKLLLEELEKAKESGKQSILFKNRRGFAPMLECFSCKWVPNCVSCDISLTYHKAVHQLKCHYCGYSMNVPGQCADCKSTDMRMKGFGTEKIEEELNALLPNLQVARMDLDTTRSKYAHHKLIEDFEEKRIDALVGTQMVSKGLDFGDVHLSAVLNADAMIHYPDFRAHERSFQLLTQVTGRAGRRKEPGLAIIQTWDSDHPVLKWVQNGDYAGFFKAELHERKQFAYPPFSRLINIYMRHESAKELDNAADFLGCMLRESFANRVLGPEYPPVSKVRNLFQKNLMLRIEPRLDPQKVKARIAEVLKLFHAEYPLKGMRIIVDVDP
jgi:primosomal protein N' (replication factor Y)